MNGVDDRAGDLEHFGYIFEQTCTGTFTGYFFDRATEIYIDEIGLCCFYNACRLRHRFGFTTINLDRHRTLSIMDGQFACGGSDVANECVGVDELGVDAIGSVAFA